MSDQGNNSGAGTPTSVPTPTSVNSPASAPQTPTLTYSVAPSGATPSMAQPTQIQTVAPIQQGTLLSTIQGQQVATQILPSQHQNTAQIQATQLQPAPTAQIQATQLQQAPTAGAVVRSSLPHIGQVGQVGQIGQVGQVSPMGQVSHLGQMGHINHLGQVQFLQPVNNPFALQQQQQQQFNFQQQFMFQNAAAVQAMQAQALNTQVSLATVQNRPPSVGNGSSAGALSQSTTQVWPEQKSVASSQTLVSGAVMATQTSKGNMNNSRPGNTTISQQQQAVTAQMIGQKQVIQQRAGPTPLVIGPLGVLSNPNVNVSGQQMLASQPKSPSVSIAGQQTQLINSPTQIRFSAPHAFVTNTGQIFTAGGNPGMLNQFQTVATLQQNMHQPVLASQSATFLGTQPLYIRQAGPLPPQAQIVGNVQTVAPQKGKIEVNQVKGQPTQVKTVTTASAIKGVANILPQGPRPGIPGATTIRPATHQVRPAANIQPKGPTGIQPKQVSKVRAMKTPGKTTPTTTPPRIAPNLGQVRLGPGPGQPPTIVVPPKQQTIALKPVEIKPLPAPAISTNVSPEKTPPVSQSPNGQTGTGTPQHVANGNQPVQPEIKQEEPMEEDCNGGNKQPNTDASSVSISEVVVNGGKQKAIVKPHVLTHVIGGFVIQEAPEPFPVQRSAMLEFLAEKAPLIEEPDPAKDTEERPGKKAKLKSSSKSDSSPWNFDDFRSSSELKLKCEFCGKMDSAKKFRRSKRFCSMACAKRYNVGCSRRMGLFQSRPGGGKYNKKKKSLPLIRTWKRGQGGRVTTGPLQRPADSQPLTSAITGSTAGAPAFPPENTNTVATATESSTSASDTERDTERSTTPSNLDESSCPRSPPELERVVQMDIEPSPPAAVAPKRPSQAEPEEVLPPPERRHPSKWTVNDVYQFIKSLPGCQIYSDEFNRQEIDGQALMLLKEDHLMSAMSIKLGPALKICARINQLKDELS